MTAARVPEGAVLLAGRQLAIVAWAIRQAQDDYRRRNGANSSELAALLAVVSPPGHGDTPAGAEPHPETMTTTEAAHLLGMSPRTVRRKADALGGRLVGGVLVFNRQAVLEHRDGQHLRSNTP